MISTPTDRTHFVTGPRATLVPLVLLGLLALFPPETRGESLAGCALLVLLLAALSWPGRLGPGRAGPLVLLLLAVFPLRLVAQAEGAVLEPWAVVVLGAAAGLAVSCLPIEVRAGRSLPLVLGLIGGLLGVWAVYQNLWGLEALARAVESGMQVPDAALNLDRARGGRAFAGFPTPAALGGYLVVVLPVTVVAAATARGRERWGLGSLALLQLAGLLMSASITAVAAIVAALLLAGLRGRVGRLRVGAAAAVLLAALLMIVVARGTEVTRPDERGSPWKLRAANFTLAAEMIGDHPWTGVGFGGFGEAYPGYRRPGDNETQHVHNLPLELTAETGVVAGGLASTVFFVLFAGPLLRRTAGSPAWWRGVEIGLAAFAVHNLADFTAFLPSVLWSAALLRGWVERRESALVPGSARLWSGTALAATTLATVVAVLGGLAWNARGESKWAEASGDRAAAHLSAVRAVRLAPWNVDGRLILGGLELERDAGSEAGSAVVERAVVLSPIRPAARRLRSLVRISNGDLPGAFSDAVVGERLYPQAPVYRDHRVVLEQALLGALPGQIEEPR